MIRCEVCQESLTKPARGRVPRFCGTRCRVAAHRKETKFYVPNDLREEPRWILHKDKRPLALGNYWLSINDSSKWASFTDAKNSEHGDGIGFVLNGDGIVCIDLDDCVEDGVISEEAQKLIDSLPRTFVELSPSGRGLHIWGFGEVSVGRRFERNGLKIEVYGEGRYLTVSGNAVVKSKLAELDLRSLVA